MLKRIFTIIVFLPVIGLAQVGIGTTNPDASSALDISSTDKGFLMPRMTTANRTAIASPAEGLQVYDTDTKSVWTYDGTAWQEGVGGGGKFVDGDASDIAYYSGRVGIGRSGFSNVHKMYVENNLNGGQNTLVKFDAIFDGTGNSLPVYGLGSQARNAGTGSITYTIGTQPISINSGGGTTNYSVGSWAQLFNQGTSTTDWGAALVAEIYNYGGTITTGYGQNIGVTNDATMGQASLASFYMTNNSTITGNGYGIWIGGAGSGTVGGNAYALYIATPYSNVTGNSYALYSENTSDSYIEGNLGVGTNAPQQKVHINGVMRLEPQAAAPAGGLGDLYVGTDGKLYFHDGTQWREVSLAPAN